MGPWGCLKVSYRTDSFLNHKGVSSKQIAVYVFQTPTNHESVVFVKTVRKATFSDRLVKQRYSVRVASDNLKSHFWGEKLIYKSWWRSLLLLQCDIVVGKYSEETFSLYHWNTKRGYSHTKALVIASSRLSAITWSTWTWAEHQEEGGFKWVCLDLCFTHNKTHEPLKSKPWTHVVAIKVGLRKRCLLHWRQYVTFMLRKNAAA